jgi:flavin-dependent dehydrogenase
VTGPFAVHSSRAWGRGVALVGDAADFFDPFTGEGIYAALRGGELLAPFALEALAAARARGADDALRAYDRARRSAFRGKWAIERLVALAVGAPALLNRVATVLEASPAMANLFVGVAGDFVPAREVLRPGYLARLIFGNVCRSRNAPIPLSP